MFLNKLRGRWRKRWQRWWRRSHPRGRKKTRRQWGRRGQRREISEEVWPWVSNIDKRPSVVIMTVKGSININIYLALKHAVTFLLLQYFGSFPSLGCLIFLSDFHSLCKLNRDDQLLSWSVLMLVPPHCRRQKSWVWNLGFFVNLLLLFTQTGTDFSFSYDNRVPYKVSQCVIFFESFSSK